MKVSINLASILHILQFLKKKSIHDIQMIFVNDGIYVLTKGEYTITQSIVKNYEYIEKTNVTDYFEVDLNLFLRIIQNIKNETFFIEINEKYIIINHFFIRSNDCDILPLLPVMFYNMVSFEYDEFQSLIQQLTLFKTESIHFIFENNMLTVQTNTLDMEYKNIVKNNTQITESITVEMKYFDLLPLLKCKRNIICLGVHPDFPILFFVDNDDYQIRYYLRSTL